ncbi:MAG: U32 family peptidase [Lachnospiraceae bacterium]|nr:U32 family peptidase [Lachnospiraceae bacterium]
MNKVELLAPAGNYSSFVGAIAAGADAVYIGGRMYGARAYADNFSDEEVCRAIRYAHLCGRKIYMTINTLMKQREIDELADYMRPFYEEGLDGVIVQDMGAICLFKAQFPDMEIHASTQLTITGVYGAEYLKELGITRVVPARECSLEEIRRIRNEVGIEVEAFIHGAMCYSYSGQCLFSSMLGGRSGNRGRCAQPCRLPYRVTSSMDKTHSSKNPHKEEYYPLSLKDMCTLSVLPELLKAGIDSFKIEGRMKSPEYAAGVTALYRKYIDRYYADPHAPYMVDPDDLKALMSLYIRSDIQDGYYFKHNGKEMITPGKPGYLKTDDKLLQRIRERYLNDIRRVTVSESVYLTPGEPSVLVLTSVNNSGEGVAVSVSGDVAEAAQKSPLSEEAVRKQLLKAGDSLFSVSDCNVVLSGNVFMPVKSLNSLRREGFAALEEALLSSYKRHSQKADLNASEEEDTLIPHMIRAKEARYPYLAAEVRTLPALKAVLEAAYIGRVYIDADLLMSDPEAILALKSAVDKVLYVSMPYILRARDDDWLIAFRKEILEGEDKTLFSGILARNTETLGFLKGIGYSGGIMCDAGLYSWNRSARLFWRKRGYAFTYPLECNREDLVAPGLNGEMILYGRTPLMLSANCVRKTCFSCKNEGNEYLFLHDRYGTAFPVLTDCRHCMNIIYNSLPLSLHGFSGQISSFAEGGRLCFTTERVEEVRQVLSLYQGFFDDEHQGNALAPFSFTKGHYKRGAE